MEFAYTAYTKDKKLVKGKLSANTIETASKVLDYGGYQVISIKPVTISLANLGQILGLSGQPVGPKDILMFSRQLALLLESGNDLVSSIELIEQQTTVKSLRKILGEVVRDVRGGSSFSTALSKHPRSFSSMYVQAMAAGEQAGNLDVVLRQMADYLYREVTTGKKVKNALTYPIVIFVVAIVVVAILAIFVMPVFSALFESFGATLPLPTRILIGLCEWISKYILWVLAVVVAVFAFGYAYIRTPKGRLWWDTLSLNLPVVGRINLLNELSRCCRTMALLFKVGLPLPEILAQAIRGTSNQAFGNSLKRVQEELIRGEGLSKPMSQDPLFLPLMVQMISVGEETGNLDNSMTTVAMSYETESDDRTSAAVGMIQPALTILIALIVGFVAVSLVSAMYGIYSQVDL